MTITCSMSVPADKFQQFHEILCATGGRYLQTYPHFGETQHYVAFEMGDYEAFNRAWERCTTPIRETYRESFFQRIQRRINFRKRRTTCGKTT